MDLLTIKLFDKMFDVNFFANRATSTNLNAAAKRPHLHPTDNVNATLDSRWQSTTASETQVFVGMEIVMRIKDMPEYQDNWSEEPILHDEFIQEACGIFPLLGYQ